jgi:hypothetical protein
MPPDPHFPALVASLSSSLEAKTRSHRLHSPYRPATRANTVMYALSTVEPAYLQAITRLHIKPHNDLESPDSH